MMMISWGSRKIKWSVSLFSLQQKHNVHVRGCGCLGQEDPKRPKGKRKKRRERKTKKKQKRKLGMQGNEAQNQKDKNKTKHDRLADGPCQNARKWKSCVSRDYVYRVVDRRIILHSEGSGP